MSGYFHTKIWFNEMIAYEQQMSKITLMILTLNKKGKPNVMSTFLPVHLVQPSLIFRDFNNSNLIYAC